MNQQQPQNLPNRLAVELHQVKKLTWLQRLQFALGYNAKLYIKVMVEQRSNEVCKNAAITLSTTKESLATPTAISFSTGLLPAPDEPNPQAQGEGKAKASSPAANVACMTTVSPARAKENVRRATPKQLEALKRGRETVARNRAAALGVPHRTGEPALAANL